MRTLDFGSHRSALSRTPRIYGPGSGSAVWVWRFRPRLNSCSGDVFCVAANLVLLKQSYAASAKVQNRMTVLSALSTSDKYRANVRSFQGTRPWLTNDKKMRACKARIIIKVKLLTANQRLEADQAMSKPRLVPPLFRGQRQHHRSHSR